MSLALYREFRSATFNDVVGQEHITTAIKKELVDNTVGHAYLFHGTHGIGKTTIGKLLGRAVNCLNLTSEGEPCNECDNCKQILKDAFIDYREIDAASNNGVDHVREIVREVSYPPAMGKKKVYIIDEAHMLSTDAFNALLKKLEEPPSHVLFILATTELHKILPTVRSRCKMMNLKNITMDTVVDRLKYILDKKQCNFEPEALEIIASQSNGSLRDALSILDTCYKGYGEVTVENVTEALGIISDEFILSIARCILTNDINVLSFVAEAFNMGANEKILLTDIKKILRDLLLLDVCGEGTLDCSITYLDKIRALSGLVSKEYLNLCINQLNDLEYSLVKHSNPRHIVEMGFLKLITPEFKQSYDELVAEITRLSKEVEDLKSNNSVQVQTIIHQVNCSSNTSSRELDENQHVIISDYDAEEAFRECVEIPEDEIVNVEHEPFLTETLSDAGELGPLEFIRNNGEMAQMLRLCEIKEDADSIQVLATMPVYVVLTHFIQQHELDIQLLLNM